MRVIFGRYGAFILLDDFEKIPEDKRKKILKSMSVTEIPIKGKPAHLGNITMKAYKIIKAVGNKKYLRIPLVQITNTFLNPFIDNFMIENTLPQPRKIHDSQYETSVEFYDYQIATINYLANRCKDVHLIPLTVSYMYLQMDTGLGKTRVALGFIAKRKEPALIVVPIASIAYQWIDEIKIQYPKLKCGLYSNKIPILPQDYDVIIVIINTVRAKEVEFMEGYGVVILDEAHEYNSPENKKVLDICVTKCTLGLSATPHVRKDGLDRYIDLFLGQIITQSMIPEFDISKINFEVAVECVQYYGACELILSAQGTTSFIGTVLHLCSRSQRLKLVCDKIQELDSMHLSKDANAKGLGMIDGKLKRHGILVMAELRSYLDLIADELKRRKISYEIDDDDIKDSNDIKDSITYKASDEIPADIKQYENYVKVTSDLFVRSLEVLTQAPKSLPESSPESSSDISIVRGGISSDDFQKAKENGAHIILSTYGYSRRGLSFREMTSLVLATPRRSGIIQILGRILRRGGDESILRQVIDIRDMKSSLSSQYFDREKEYKARNYTITNKKVKPTGEDIMIQLLTTSDESSQLLTTEIQLDLSKMSNEELINSIGDFSLI